jgi:flagellar motor protein MotB
VKRWRHILAFVAAIAASCNIYSQSYHTNSSRAINAYVLGKEQYEFLYFPNAEKKLLEAISYDKKFYEAYMLLGELCSKQRRFTESAKYYREAVKLDSLYFKPVFYSLGNAEMMSGDYKRALFHFSLYLDLKTGSDKNSIAAAKGITDCKFALTAIASPVPFNPVSLGDSVNTTNDEYWPSLTADGQTLMFTRQMRAGGTYSRNQEDFYYSTLRSGNWSMARNAGAPLNTPQNEGAQSISSDGNYMFFTACDRAGGKGKCDIYFSGFDGSGWSLPVNIGPPVNTSYWESQPSISSNGNLLFFASNRPGGLGGMDLWYSVRSPGGKWSIPKNPGPVINTAGDEMSPFIHFDGKTLYFSSSGHPGMGGFDLYLSRMSLDSTFSVPVNLGYPINTYNDELGLMIDATGQNAYFSSVRNEKFGKDIFNFLLYEAARPDPVSYFRGKVFDRETMKLLRSDYELVNLKTGQIVSSGSTDASGNFLVCLPVGYNYGLNVNSTGYLFYSDNFMLESVHSATKPYIKRVLLNPIKVGEVMQLTNIFFGFDSVELKKESVTELNKLSKLLGDNPDIIIEVAGFTDSIGTQNYNISLSERRARMVVKYLIDKGIEPARLKIQAYGAASPIGTNITNEGRKLNRRTEVRIIGKKK